MFSTGSKEFPEKSSPELRLPRTGHFTRLPTRTRGAINPRKKNDQHRPAPLRRVEGRTGLRHPTLITWSPHRPSHKGPRMITA
jgi:hypothetical protein